MGESSMLPFVVMMDHHLPTVLYQSEMLSHFAFVSSGLLEWLIRATVRLLQEERLRVPVWLGLVYAQGSAGLHLGPP